MNFVVVLAGCKGQVDMSCPVCWLGGSCFSQDVRVSCPTISFLLRPQKVHFPKWVGFGGGERRARGAEGGGHPKARRGKGRLCPEPWPPQAKNILGLFSSNVLMLLLVYLLSLY